MEIKDKIGAGDAFDSGFIAGIRAGLSLEEAARWGNACAAYSLQYEGGRHTPTGEQLLSFLALAQKI